jgi:hypothetical protein
VYEFCFLFIFEMRGSVERAFNGEQGVNIVNSHFHQDIVRTPVTSALTSNHNIRYLQEQLIFAVQRATGVLIGPQSMYAIADILKRIYLSSGPYFVHLPDQEVSRINQVFLIQTIHDTTQAVQSYQRYLNDAFTQPIPPDRGDSTSVKGSRSMEISRFL